MLVLAAMLALAQPEAPLAGPAVKERVPGLVQHEMSGRVIRPVRSIEQTVVERMKLSPEVRERVERVLSERAAALDKFVVENLLLLNQLQTVQAAGSLRERIVVGVEAVQKLAEAIGGRSLREEIVKVLSEEDARAFKAAMREYWAALSEEARAMKPKDPPPRWAVYLGEQAQALGREIAGSFERQSASGTLFLDYLVAGLELNESQREIIHELKLDLLEKTGMRPTEEDQKKLILSAAAYLNKDQRAKAIAKVAGKK